MHEPCCLWSVLSLEHVKAAIAARENGTVKAALRRAAPFHSEDLSPASAVVIPIHGIIAPPEWYGDVSPAEISSALSAASRSSARTVVLDINSPGGIAWGVPEVADQIYALRSKKRVIAVANSMMASAAYWLGSQAHEIVAAGRSSVVGSVGVFVTHVDFSGADAKAGVKVTNIVSTDAPFKAEADSSQPLSEQARAHLQTQIDETTDMFIGDIARGRGITPATVKAKYGKGRTMYGVTAKNAGLVDRVATMQAVVDGLVRDAQARAEREEVVMKVRLGERTDAPWSVRTTNRMSEIFYPARPDDDEA